MANQYTSVAKYYDSFNKNVNYRKVADYLEKIFESRSLSPEIILDMACGTGNLTLELDKRGCDMIGLDLSVDMLNAAASKKRKRKDGNILWLNQDMTDFELYGSVDAVVCCFDSLNYIIEEEKVKKCFQKVKNYLSDGGVFIFDVNSKYKFENVLAGKDIIIESNGNYCLWENFYDKKSGICEMSLKLFIKEDSGLYRLLQEEQTQKYHSIEFLKESLLESGFKNLSVHYDFEPIKKSGGKNREEKICICCQK